MWTRMRDVRSGVTRKCGGDARRRVEGRRGGRALTRRGTGRARDARRVALLVFTRIDAFADYTYDVGGLHSSESMRSHGNTSLGSG